MQKFVTFEIDLKNGNSITMYSPDDMPDAYITSHICKLISKQDEIKDARDYLCRELNPYRLKMRTRPKSFRRGEMELNTICFNLGMIPKEWLR